MTRPLPLTPNEVGMLPAFHGRHLTREQLADLAKRAAEARDAWVMARGGRACRVCGRVSASNCYGYVRGRNVDEWLCRTCGLWALHV